MTLGVTCFNAEATIEAALESCLAQDWLDREIVVVDDASTDRSAVVIQSFIDRHSDAGIRFIAKAVNQGYPAALNTIIEVAIGDFVAFFDDDDLSRADRVRLQMVRVQAYPQPDVLCYSNRQVEPEHGKPHTAFAIGRHAVEPYGQVVADFILWSRGAAGYCWGAFGSCTLLAPTGLLRRLGGFDENFRRCAEWDLAIRHALAGGHFVAVDDALVTQRKTPGTDKAGLIPLNYALRLREKYRPMLERRHCYLGARLVARSRHWGARGRKWRSRTLYALAALVSPPILRDRLRRS